MPVAKKKKFVYKYKPQSSETVFHRTRKIEARVPLIAMSVFLSMFFAGILFSSPSGLTGFVIYQEQLVNGGFEADNVGVTTITGWTNVGGSATGSVQLAPSGAPAGSIKSLKFTIANRANCQSVSVGSAGNYNATAYLRGFYQANPPYTFSSTISLWVSTSSSANPSNKGLCTGATSATSSADNIWSQKTVSCAVAGASTIYVCVGAPSSSGYDVYADNVSFLISQASAPAAVNTLQAVAGVDHVNLSWSAPDDGGSAIQCYKVFNATSGGGPYNIVSSAGAGGCNPSDPTDADRTFRHAPLSGTNPIYYVVRAQNQIGPGSYSNEVSATLTTTSTSTPPGGSSSSTTTIPPNPTISSTTPIAGATEVSNRTAVIINFNKQMNTTSVASAVSITPAISFSKVWDQTNKILNLTFVSDLQKQNYTVTINTEAKDTDGNRMLAPYTFAFSVKGALATPPPNATTTTTTLTGGTTSTTTPTGDFCSDSDESATDQYGTVGVCTDKDGGHSDTCETNKLKEYRCTAAKKCEVEAYTCPYGCAAGACSPRTTATTSPTGVSEQQALLAVISLNDTINSNLGKKNITEAEALYIQAIAAYNNGNYDEALKLANQAGGAIKEFEKPTETGGGLPITEIIIGIVALIILGGIAFYVKKNGLPKFGKPPSGTQPPPQQPQQPSTPPATQEKK